MEMSTINTSHKTVSIIVADGAKVLAKRPPVFYTVFVEGNPSPERTAPPETRIV